MLGFFYLYISTLFEKYTYFHNNQAENRDFQSSVTLFLCAILLVVIHAIFNGSSLLDFNTYIFLSDYIFYLWFFSEFFAFLAFRKATFYNEGNYTAVSFVVFSTTYSIPILAYFYDQYFHFENSIQTPYSSFSEAVGISVLLFFITIAYFYDKIAHKFGGKLWMLLLWFSLINTIYFSTKLVQRYDGFLVYGFITFIMSLQFFILAMANKDKVNLIETFRIKNLISSLSWFFVVAFDVLAMQYLAVEFVAIFRRTSQILSGMTIDFFFAKQKRAPTHKDKVVVIVLIIFAFSLYYIKF